MRIHKDKLDDLWNEWVRNYQLQQRFGQYVVNEMGWDDPDSDDLFYATRVFPWNIGWWVEVYMDN